MTLERIRYDRILERIRYDRILQKKVGRRKGNSQRWDDMTWHEKKKWNIGHMVCIQYIYQIGGGISPPQREYSILSYDLPDASSHFHQNASTIQNLSILKGNACPAARRENSQVWDLCVRFPVRAGTLPRTRCRTSILLHETTVIIVSEDVIIQQGAYRLGE